MPPRLFAPGALRRLTQPIRLFSSTPSAASPPRAPPHHTPPHQAPQHQAPSPGSSPAASSTARLLSLNREDQPAARRQGNDRAGVVATRLLDRYKNRDEASMRQREAQLEFLRNQKDSVEYLKQMPRRWQLGDVYSPHDLSAVEMRKWRRRSARQTDVIDALGIRPLDMYKNFSLVQEFTTSSGQITRRQYTRLRPVNQRKVAKMIRRLQGMGLYPTIHDHPEMLRSTFYPERR